MKKTMMAAVVASTLFITVGANAAGFEKVFVISPNQVDDVVFKEDGLVINNFSVAESSSFLSKSLKNISVSVSAKNSTEKPIMLSIMAVGFNSEQPLWAVSVEPMMSMLSAQRTDTLKQDVFSNPGTLKKTDKIWIKITGELK